MSNNGNSEKIGVQGCPSILRLMINGVAFGFPVSFNSAIPIGDDGAFAKSSSGTNLILQPTPYRHI